MEKSSHLVAITIAASALLASTLAHARSVLHVPAQYPTIQQAIDASSAGDLIRVGRGEYHDNVIIVGRSDLRLHASRAVLHGAGIGIGIHVLDSDQIEIQGFEVRGFEAGIVLDRTTHSRVHNITTHGHDSPTSSLRDGLQLVASHHNSVANVRAHNNGHNGITLKAGSSNNRITANAASDNGQNPDVAANIGGCGIQLIGAHNNANTIRANETHRNGWGIQVGGGSNHNRVLSNRSHGNARAGVVVLDPGHRNVIGQNRAMGNGLADVPPSGTFDLFDQGALDNLWRNNKGSFNY